MISAATAPSASPGLRPDVDAGPVLLYDGTCGFCARSVRFVLAHDKGAGSLRFARLEGPIGRQLLAGERELSGGDSVVWYDPRGDGRRALARSAATIAVLRYLGGRWSIVAAMLTLVPRVLRDAGYNFVARHRHRIAGRDVCVIPTAEQLNRFLDPPD